LPNQTHAKTVVTADDGVSEVGSDEWNAQHYLNIPTNDAYVAVDHLNIAQRIIAAGTGRLTVREPLQPLKGGYLLGSVQLITDQYLLQYKRATLNGNARVDLSGTAELYMFDLAPVGRLVLAGRGG
jgi:hypothetical protein